MYTAVILWTWSFTMELSELFGQPISNLEPAVPICVESASSLQEVVSTLQENRIGCVLVVREKRLVGVITERDFAFKILGRGLDLAGEIVDDFMTTEPETLSPDDPVAYALNRMNMGGYRHVPLLDDSGTPVGIISVKDIVQWIVKEFPNEILNLPPHPSVYGVSREGA